MELDTTLGFECEDQILVDCRIYDDIDDVVQLLQDQFTNWPRWLSDHFITSDPINCELTSLNFLVQKALLILPLNSSSPRINPSEIRNRPLASKSNTKPKQKKTEFSSNTNWLIGNLFDIFKMQITLSKPYSRSALCVPECDGPSTKNNVIYIQTS